jgi:hypothetical protein
MTGQAIIFFALLASAGSVVQVDFYFEIGCPVCGSVLSGVMAKEVATQYGSSVNVTLHPWGNTYVATQKCKGGGAPAGTQNPDPRYNAVARKCWDSECGAEASKKAPDCFSPGEMICQHGPPACELQYYAICGNQASGPDWKKALKFSACLDNSFNMGVKYGWPAGTVEVIAQDCAGKSGLNFGHLKYCAKGAAGHKALIADAEQTPAHTLVPYVTVDGAPVQGVGLNPDLIVAAIAEKTSRRLLV